MNVEANSSQINIMIRHIDNFKYIVSINSRATSSRIEYSTKPPTVQLSVGSGHI